MSGVLFQHVGEESCCCCSGSGGWQNRAQTGSSPALQSQPAWFNWISVCSPRPSCPQHQLLRNGELGFAVTLISFPTTEFKVFCKSTGDQPAAAKRGV